MHVVATAGHVDHGKSTLIHALTGQQPDRLAEERRRGLSIELGYCWTQLPSAGDVAFVDVPGHERFVSTMLAGVGAVPTVLFVVAADDPWMPQAAEHLAILDALGVDRGVLAITRSDLGDTDAALVRARTAMSATGLAHIPSVAVSGATGQGLPELRRTLDDVLSAAPSPDPADPVRIWVDRVFSKRGAGTIVTGTLPSGRVRTGDSLQCMDQSMNVRGLQTLGREVDEVVGLARVSLRLGSSESTRLRRGVALTTADAWCNSRIVDVRLSGNVEPPTEPILHVGAASVLVRARPLTPTDSGWIARLTLETELPWHIGDRAVLRDPGQRTVWGCLVLDPAGPTLRRRGDAQRRGKALACATGTPDLAEELSRRRTAPQALLRRLGVARAELPDLNGWLIDASIAAEVSTALATVVAEHAAAHPLDAGIALADAARKLRIDNPQLLVGLVQPPLVYAEGRIRPARSPLPDSVDRALRRLDDLFVDHPFRAPDSDELRELGLDRRALAAAARVGRLLRLSDSVVLQPGSAERAVGLLRTLPQPFTASQAREILDTSRRVVLPLLDHLDTARLTHRLPDDRRIVVARLDP